MSQKVRKRFSQALSIVKCALAVFLMYAGIDTAARPQFHYPKLDFVLGSQITLGIAGMIYFISGLILFVGKIMKKRTLVGHGLMGAFCSFLFSGFLVWYGYNFLYALPNLIVAFCISLLYLRWKYHIYYDNEVVKRII